jgi:hypothetical protein
MKDLGGFNGSRINGVHAPLQQIANDILEFGATNFRVVSVKGGDFTDTAFAEVVVRNSHVFARVLFDGWSDFSSELPSAPLYSEGV